MKVCLVNSYYPPYVGGAETYVWNLARRLADKGDEVTVYCAAKPLPPGTGHDGKVEVIRMRVAATFYGTPIAIFPPRFFTEPYDVVHANFPSPYLAAMAALRARCKARVAVLTWHNDLPPVTSSAGLVVRLHNSLFYPYLGAFKAIIATTRVYARDSTLLRRFHDKVRVIPGGVDTRTFHLDGAGGMAVRARYGFEERTVVLFVGALTTWHVYKGLDVLLKAFAVASRYDGDLRLMVVGEGNLKNSYVKLAADLRIEKKVVFAGYVSAEELPMYYSACDLFVLPSKDASEGFGLVLLEAMACGKSVVASAIGGTPDVVEDGENGLLVRPQDVGGLTDAILKLGTNRDLRNELGVEGRRFAESRDWDAMAAQISRLYRELMQGA